MVISAEKISPVVLKFGGSSVAETKHWTTIVARLKHELRMGHSPVLVLSALKDVSNTLEGILHLALAGDFQVSVTELVEKHIQFALQLNLSIERDLNQYLTLLTKLCQQIQSQQQISPKIHAQVLAIGELMSTTIGCAFINQSQVVAKWVDARQLLKSETQPDQWHHFTSAVCDFSFCEDLSKQLFETDSTTKVIVTQGFIASDSKGRTVLLGREGSDTSAAYLAAKLGAKDLQIWTDVTGVFTANPADVPKAKQISKLSYQQAHTMAVLGAKVLHPKVIKPIASNNIPLRVKSTWFPQHSGTEIGSLPQSSSGVIGVMLLRNCTMLQIPLSYFETLSLEKTKLIIAELGFDLLLNHSAGGRHEMVLKYTNTDKAIPLATDMARLLAIEQEHISLNSDLLSVVGSREDLSWLVNVEAKLEQCQTKCFKAQLISPQEGRVSFYLNENTNPAIVSQLHDKLFNQ